MRKALAHIILTVLDILAFIFLYAVASQLNGIKQSILGTQEIITFESTLSYTLLLLLIPALHLYSLTFEKTDIPKRYKHFGSIYLSIAALSILGTKHIVDANIRSTLFDNDYKPCKIETGRKYEKITFCKALTDDMRPEL